MTFDSLVAPALDQVLDWGLPDDACPAATAALAQHMAGQDSDQAGVDLG